jgi:hypothetical protein
MNRRAARTAALAALLACWWRVGAVWAAEITVPVPLQADLLEKVAAYDRNLPARAGDRVVTLLLVKPGSDASQRAAAQLEAALEAKPTIAGLPHHVEPLQAADAAAIAESCRQRRAAILFVTPGFTEAEVAALGRALDGVDVLSVAAVPQHVAHGIVLGFDLVSGKPKLLVSLSQAQRQKVALSANVLRLMTVLP